ncbi:MAG: hypothetical protein ABI638_03280 [Ignavibacteriota bacterium]
MKKADFKYDVAFAFLKKDEHLANQINDLIYDKLKTFLYSKKQEDRALRNRDKVFFDVFAKQSRVVVIIYGSKWGTTPWTEIEEKLIRTRVSDEGEDFLLLIPIDNPPITPKYLPKAQICADLPKSGIKGAVNVILEKVRSLGRGSEKPLQINLDTENNSEPQFEVESSKFLESVSGLEIAVIELKKLFSALEIEKNKITESDKNISLTYKRDDKNCSIHYGVFSIRFYLQTEKSNLLMNSPLYFEMQKQDNTSNGLNILAVEEYHFELKKVGVYGWINGADSGSFISSKQLAKDSLNLLLNQVDDE